ncbi:MAG TPA: ABC-F family ATP-binding cassette domain-containing protein [Ktedonobacteraceae bacterium]|jgi:macrolide transport system ATP-binding/permease protein
MRVLQSISLTLNAGDRAGLVGANGVGKSTLLRLLIGQEEADAGSLALGSGVEAGYLPQSTPAFYGRSIQDLLMEACGHLRRLEDELRRLELAMETAGAQDLPALLEAYGHVSTRFQDAGGYDREYRMASLMDGLRLAYLPRERAVQTLSGGERARLGLAVLLLRSPDLLLLDEPTNHLDFASLAWLEDYLAGYRGGLLIVSHDRQFLNRTVNRILEIDEHTHQLAQYPGNYDAYVDAREQERRKWEQDYMRQQEEMRGLRRRIKEATGHARRNYHTPRDNDKFARHYYEQSVQRTQAQTIRAAEVELERLTAAAVPRPPDVLHINSQFQSAGIQAREVVHLAGVSKGWDGRQVLRDVALSIAPGARLVLIGPNGVGKSTLCRLIMGLEQPDQGEIRIAPGACIGYLPQDLEGLDPRKTVLETYRYGQVGYEGEFVGRLIGYGFFHLQDMHKRVGQLSPGQQRKLEIACLMARRPNVLLLDEPTNYISLDVLEAFEAAILAFPGPVLAISHDRWFIQRFGGVRWTLEEGRVVKWPEGD